MANLKELSGNPKSPLALPGAGLNTGKQKAAWWVSALAFAVLLGLMLPTLFSPGLKAAPIPKTQTGNAVTGTKEKTNGSAPTPTPTPEAARHFESGLSGDDYKFEAIDPPSLSDIGSKLVMAMAIMLILGSGLVLVAKKLTMGPLAGKSAGKLQLVDTLSLGRRCELHLVEIDGTRILVGVDPTGLKSLLSLPEEFRDVADRAEGGTSALAPTQHPAAAFATHWPGPADGPAHAT